MPFLTRMHFQLIKRSDQIQFFDHKNQRQFHTVTSAICELVHSALLKQEVGIAFIKMALPVNASYPTGNYIFKVNNRNTRTRPEICSELTIKIPEQRQWRSSGILIVNIEHISHLLLVFLALTLSR